MHPETRRVIFYSITLALLPSLSMLHSIFMPVDGWHDRFGYTVGRDFSNFWMAGRLASQGKVDLIYDLAGYHAVCRETLAAHSPFMNFSYPPNSLPLLLIIGMMPFGLALPLWLFCGIIAWSFATTGRLVPADREAATLFALAILTPAALLTFVDGQASFLLAGLLIGALRLLKQRPMLAGLMLGLLTVKPQLGLLVPLVLVMRRQWLATASAIATAALLVATSLALFGSKPWLDYMANTLPYQSRALAEPFGLAWSLMTTPYAFFMQTGAGQSAAKALHAATAFGVLALAASAILRSRSIAADCVVAAFAAVLMSPYVLAYDLAIPTAALFWLLSERRAPLGRLGSGLLALFLALPVAMMLLNVDGFPVMPPVVLALFVVIAIHILRDGRLDPRPAAA